MALLGGVSQISDGDTFEGEVEEVLDDEDVIDVADEITVDGIAEELSEEIPLDVAGESIEEVNQESVESVEGVVSGGQAADEEIIDESGTALDDITVVDLPVTIAKEDGGEGEECSGDDVEAISLNYTEENVTRRRIRGLGTMSTPLAEEILAGILSSSINAPSGAKGLNEAFVFVLPKSILLASEGDGEFSVETCEVFSDDEDGIIYRWTTLDPEELAGVQLETGRVRLRLQQTLVNRSGSLLEFTGISSRFHLSAADFGDEASETTPFIVLR